jgi:acetyl esterase/lipase
MKPLVPSLLIALTSALLLGSHAAGAAAEDLAAAAAAAEPADLQGNVWPGRAPGESALPAIEEKWGPDKPSTNPNAKPIKRVTNVTVPTLTVFPAPADKNTGVAVIVCPGGGYKALMMDYEGEDVARWLNTLGITGIVLKYRVREAEPPAGTPRYLAGLQDAQRAISLVRFRAAEWKIDPQRIGILGFSAGGHLSCAASTNFDKRAYESIDDVDKVSCRPDFAVVIYPGGVVKKGAEGLSEEIRVTKDTPPAFIVQAHDDRVNSENSVYYYLALKRAGVPAELHIYGEGGHGFGIKPADKPHASWPQRCAEWMKERGLLKAAGAAS